MSSREYFAKFDYVPEAYKKALAAYDRSLRSSKKENHQQSRNELGQAANILCAVLNRIAEDPKLDEGMKEFEGELNEHRDELHKIFADLENFLEFEYRVLIEAGLSPEEAARLLADVTRAIRMVEGLPDVHHINNLRDRLRQSAAIICVTEQELQNATDSPTMLRKFLKGLRPVGHGLGLIGGVTLFVLNATSGAILTPLGVSSMLGGLAATTNAMDKLGNE